MRDITKEIHDAELFTNSFTSSIVKGMDDAWKKIRGDANSLNSELKAADTLVERNRRILLNLENKLNIPEEWSPGLRSNVVAQKKFLGEKIAKSDSIK